MKDGGPAFPGTIPSQDLQGVTPGMTLRDYFAAKAMQAIIAKSPWKRVPVDSPLGSDEVARGAFTYADAMLAAREARP